MKEASTAFLLAASAIIGGGDSVGGIGYAEGETPWLCTFPTRKPERRKKRPEKAPGAALYAVRKKHCGVCGAPAGEECQTVEQSPASIAYIPGSTTHIERLNSVLRR